jgi:CrcB protein
MLAVGIGGFIGANLRFWFGTWAIQRFDGRFPVGTHIVNIVGCLGLALFATLITRRVHVADPIQLMIAPGFFGALTTFSTFSVETFDLLSHGNLLTGMAYFSLSIGLGLIAVMVGIGLGHLL